MASGRRRRWIPLALVGVVSLAAAAVAVIVVGDDDRRPGDVVLASDLEDLDRPWRHESLGGCPVLGCVDEGLVLGSRAVRFEATDLAFASTVFGAGVSRVYRSEAVAGSGRSDGGDWPVGLFGAGWMTLVDSRLVEGPAYRLVTAPTEDRVAAIGLLDDVMTALWGSGEIWQFDDGGRVVRVESSTGRHMEVDWDGDSVTVTSDGDQSVEMSLDEAGRAVAARGSDGRSVIYRYVGGRLVQVSGPSGTETYGYGDSGLLETVTAPDTDMRVVYTPGGQVAEFATGAAPALRVSGQQPTITVVDPGRETRSVFEFDPEGRLVRGQTDGEEVLARDFEDGRLVRSTAPGAEVEFVYGGDGRLATAVENGTATGYAYDSLGRLVSVETADGAETRYRYDGRSSQPSQVIDPLGGVLSMGYEAGRLSEVTDADGVTETYDYDEGGNLVGIGDGSGAATSFTYDDTGRLVGRETPTGARSGAAFDDAGLLEEVTDETGAGTRVDYDTAGRPVEVQGPEGVSGYAYDESGRVAAETDPAGVTAEYGYADGTGALDSIRLLPDDGDPVTVDIDSGDGGPISASGAGGDAEVVASDAGQPTEVDLPGGRRQSLRYDQAGRLTSVTVEGLLAAGYEYDPVGRLVSSEDANGLTEQRSYDLAGRLTEIRYPDDSTWEATWTPAGRLGSVTDPDGHRTTWSYDDAGLVEEMTSPAGVTVAVDHDADGHVTSLRTASGARWDYEYDPAGRLLRAETPAGPIDYGWDDAGRLVSRVDSGGEPTRWRYDDAGRLDNVDIPGEDNDLDWRYDSLGNVVSWSEGDQDWRVERDAAGRPVHVVTPDDDEEDGYDIDWDDAGNPTVITSGDTVEERRYDPLGRLTAVSYGDETFTIDTSNTDGLVETIDDDGADPALVEYQRDARGRITLVDWGEDPDDQVQARWDHADRPVMLASGDTAIDITRNDDGQPTAVDGESTVTAAYTDGQPVSITNGDEVLLALAYADDGQVDQVRGEDVTVDFHDDGRPDTFETDSDDGAFRYDEDGTVTGLQFGEEDTTAVPVENGLATDGNDGGLLQELFEADGSYRGLPAASPVPDFTHLDGLPPEFQPAGLTPPSPAADAAEDIAAIDVTIPEPLDLADQTPEDIAADTADLILGTPLALPVHPARTALLPLFDHDGNPQALAPTRDAMWAGLIGGIADREDTTGFSDSITSYVETVVEWTGVAITAAIGLVLSAFTDPLAFVRVAAAAARDLIVNTFTDPLFLADAALTAACVASFPLCSGAIVAGVNAISFLAPSGLAALTGDDSVLDVAVETAGAVAIAAAGGYLLGRVLRPVFHRLAGSTRLGCGQSWRVCYPADRFPETAAAYRSRLGRAGSTILTPDSTVAASNRRVALRDLPTRVGFDRDEFPFAATRQGGLGALITYVTPSENRAAGAWLGNQIKLVDPGRNVLFTVIL